MLFGSFLLQSSISKCYFIFIYFYFFFVFTYITLMIVDHPEQELRVPGAPILLIKVTFTTTGAERRQSYARNARYEKCN